MAYIKGQDDLMTRARNMPHEQIAKTIQHELELCYKCNAQDKQIATLKAQNAAIQALVDTQAEDDGLWFMAATAPEAYLQQELRKLHAVIEKEVS